MKKHVKITIALAGGFVVAMLLMTIAIFIGYAKAYDTGVETSIVRLVGIPIYTLIIVLCALTWVGIVVSMGLKLKESGAFALLGAVGSMLAILFYMALYNRMMAHVENRAYSPDEKG